MVSDELYYLYLFHTMFTHHYFIICTRVDNKREEGWQLDASRGAIGYASLLSINEKVCAVAW